MVSAIIFAMSLPMPFTSNTKHKRAAVKIVFDNLDFTESLSIGFKGRHQLSLVTIVKECRDQDGNFLDADMLWSTHKIVRFFRSPFKRLRATPNT